MDQLSILNKKCLCCHLTSKSISLNQKLLLLVTLCHKIYASYFHSAPLKAFKEACCICAEQTEKAIACEHEKELREMSPRSRAGNANTHSVKSNPIRKMGLQRASELSLCSPCRSIKIASNLCGARKTLCVMKNSHFDLGRGATPRGHTSRLFAITCAAQRKKWLVERL
jgi:hypothetical protein